MNKEIIKLANNDFYVSDFPPIRYIPYKAPSYEGVKFNHALWDEIGHWPSPIKDKSLNWGIFSLTKPIN